MLMRAVLWDLDGTIIDSVDLHYRAWQATLGPRDMAYEHEDFLAGFGMSNLSVLTSLYDGQLSDAEIATLSDEKEAAYRSLVADDGIAALPGVLSWLNRFEESGLIQAIGSSAPMANIVATIAALDIADYFRVFMSGATLPKGKPDPSVFLHSAQALDLVPSECIVIEDSIHGIEAARRAGMVSVAVGDLSRDPSLSALLERISGPPCVRVSSLDELTWAELTDAIDRMENWIALHRSDIQGAIQRFRLFSSWPRHPRLMGAKAETLTDANSNDSQSTKSEAKLPILNNPRYQGDIATEPARFTTPEGSRLKFRLIRPDDNELLYDMFHQLSPESRRRRFHADVERLDDETKQLAALQLADVDNLTQGGAVLALVEEDGEEHLAGVARFARPIDKPDHPEAEAAISVRDDYQRRSVGTELLRRLVLLAKQMKIKVMLADIEADNRPAVKLFYALDLPTETDVSHGEIMMRISMPVD
jgi:beta-phosphoglucomutase